MGKVFLSKINLHDSFILTTWTSKNLTMYDNFLY